MQEIFFSSVLKTDYYRDLQSLLFFNPQQEKVKFNIIESLEKFGQPEIVVDADFLHVKVGSFRDVQTLFAFDNRNEGEKPELAGVIIYVRVNEENMIVLHIAVREEYSVVGNYCDEMLVMRFITKLRDVGRRIKDVRSIVFLYDEFAPRIPV